jgi:hypothetical protein
LLYWDLTNVDIKPRTSPFKASTSNQLNPGLSFICYFLGVGGGGGEGTAGGFPGVLG